MRRKEKWKQMNEAMRKRANWIKLTEAKEKKIVMEFNKGTARTQILREHEIPEGQFCYIIRNAAHPGLFGQSK